MFAPPAVQGSAAPEMQTVSGPRTSSQSASVVQICPPHAPSRQVARDAQSSSVVHLRPGSPWQRPKERLHRAAVTQSALLVHGSWDRSGALEHAQHPLVVGIAKQNGSLSQVTMSGPQTVVGVWQADAP